MDDQQIDEIFTKYFDKNYMINTLSNLAKIPTHVPMGYETFIDADDPKLVHYVQEVMKPEIVSLGYQTKNAPLNNLVVELGEGTSNKTILIQNYTPTQHYNLMDDPFSGKVENAREYGTDEIAVFGQGVSQNKSHQAVMLSLMKLLKDSNLKLKGKLYWAVNNEGRSSHKCSEAIVSVLEKKPNFAILQINTGMKLWLGNRGRVDVDVHVKGRATHSSSPEQGRSAIEGVNEVINRLKNLSWDDRHPLLGGRHAIVYKIKYWPVAPHTLPSDAYLAVDRRLLPGDDPGLAVKEIRKLLNDIDRYNIDVKMGELMVPAMVDAELNEVKKIRDAHHGVYGEDVEIVYGGGAFDAGGLCEIGIPTVMYGAAGGEGLLGTDFVTVDMVEKEAKVLFWFICKTL